MIETGRRDSTEPRRASGSPKAEVGLFEPLGVDRDDARPPRRRWSPPLILAALAMAALAALIGVAWLRDDGDRGTPRVVSTIDHVVLPPKAPPPSVVPPLAVTPPVAAATSPTLRDDQEVEIQNGVRIIRPRRDHGVAGGQTLRVPDADPGVAATQR